MSAAEANAITDDEARALFAGLETAKGLVLAVSGGPDSTALLVLAARWRAALGKAPKVVAVTVDHGLRKESRAEASAVKRLATRLDVTHLTRRWSGAKPSTGLQDAARRARYRLLIETARRAQADHILTAHTLDDQAETVLFRLARGSGIAGLAGMARESTLEGVTLVRPFLYVPKARLTATLAAAGIGYVDDPSNRDPRFTRPRWRMLMPALAQEGLDASRLALFARRMARADAAIEAATELAAASVTCEPRQDAFMRLRSVEFGKLPAEIAIRLLGRVIDRVGDEGPVELGKLEALYEALAAALAQTPAAPFRRTLAGALMTLSGPVLEVARAPARRTKQKARAGAASGSRGDKSPFTTSEP